MAKLFIGVALIALACAASASAAIITFQQGVSGYTHLNQDFRGTGGVNDGLQTLVGHQPGTGTNLQIRSVFGFGLSTIPAGSVINSISLRLVSDGSQAGTIAGVGTINLHEVIPNGVAANDMVEGQASNNNWKTGSLWTNTLGDYTATAMSTSTVNDANSNTTLDAGETATFGTSSAFIAAAQAALNAGLPLEFILISPTAEANNSASNFFRFRSDDFGTIADRPLLTIDYTAPVPEPGVWGLVALLLGGSWIPLRASIAKR